MILTISLFWTLLFCQSAPLTAFVGSPVRPTRSALHSTATLTDTSTVDVVGSVTFLIPSPDQPSPFGLHSPQPHPTHAQVATQLARKVNWFANGRLETNIITQIPTVDSMEWQQLVQTDALLVMGMHNNVDDDMTLIQQLFDTRQAQQLDRQCHFTLDCMQTLPAKVGPYQQDSPSLASTLLPWSTDATGRRLAQKMQTAFDRWTSDDFCTALVLFFNQFSGHQLDWVKHTTEATWEKGPLRNALEFWGMVDKCSDCIGNCVADPKCRECIGKLTDTDPRDQVASYRTIVSYESKLLEEFSLCIMTKHNIFQCDASIPQLPVVHPIVQWRGKELSVQDGKDILVGHLDDPSAPPQSQRLPTSWMVAAGANVAYDQFPLQNQIFYPTAKGSTMWYDPVFCVETLQGTKVWCHRHYRVRPQKRPGTFRFSVLDNGVTSDEYWTIVGVADDLSWVCFHYAGAAKAVGLQYLGGLICTPDGSMPTNPQQLERIYSCLHGAGIEPWELSIVNNDRQSVGIGPPPLDIYRSVAQGSAVSVE